MAKDKRKNTQDEENVKQSAKPSAPIETTIQTPQAENDKDKPDAKNASAPGKPMVLDKRQVSDEIGGGLYASFRRLFESVPKRSITQIAKSLLSKTPEPIQKTSVNIQPDTKKKSSQEPEPAANEKRKPK